MHKSGEAKKPLFDVGLNVLLGTVIGMVITLVVLYISSMAIYSGKLGEKHAEILVIVASFIGACIGAVIVVKRQGSQVLIFGAISGALYFVLILVFTVFGGYEQVLWDKLVKIGICAVMGGLLGGSLCIPRTKKRKTHK